jgi:hypothetical protein
VKTVLALELVLTRSIAGCISNNGVRKSEVCRVRRRLVPRRVQFLFPIRLVAYYFSLLKADVGQLKHFACRPITLSLLFTKRVTCHILKGPGRKGRKRDRVKSSFRCEGNYRPARPNSQVNNLKNDDEPASSKTDGFGRTRSCQDLRFRVNFAQYGNF